MTNKTLEMKPKQRRDEIKRLLHLLTDENREVFNRMYSPQDLDRDIDAVVDAMPAKQLSWALSQCKSSYHRIFNILR